MEINFNGNNYTWFEEEELKHQPEKTQEIFPELIQEFLESKCIKEDFETTGKSRRVILQHYEWKNFILSIIPLYMYSATNERNGIIKETQYFIKNI